MDDSSFKRRRGLGLVTPNACTECRKRRTKCDGQTPCAKCASQRGVHCTYEVPIRQSKDNMRTEIEHLRAQQQMHDRVLAALVSSDDSALVLDRLRHGEGLKSIITKLDTDKSTALQVESQGTTYSQPRHQQAIGSALQPYHSRAGSSNSFGHAHSDISLPDQHISGPWTPWRAEDSAPSQVAEHTTSDIMAYNTKVAPMTPRAPEPTLVGTWYQQPTSQSNPNITTRAMRSEGKVAILGPGFDQNLREQLIQPWTTVTTDTALIDHLVALYFCWEYPTFASLDKDYFLEDFRNGNPRYCSSLLVNAMLAVGCGCSTQYAARADADHSSTAGDHFFAEAVKLFEQETDRHRLTTAQALGLMSIREASRGECSKSLFYSGQSIRLAVEMGLHLESSDIVGAERTVRSATFWGAFSLDQCWSLGVGKLPHFSRDMKVVSKPEILEHVEASSWIPYTDDGAPFERNCTQPSNVQSVYKTFCELSQIVHHSLYALYTPGSAVNSKSLLRIYTQYLRWYDSIPAVLRLGQNFTPAVLFCHMYYHYAILLLFRPFLKLDIENSAVSPRDVCQQAAEAISTLLSSYDKLYTLRRTPSLVPYFALASTITHLAGLGGGYVDRKWFQQGMSDLKAMIPCHGFALRSRQILVFLNTHWEVNSDIVASIDESEGDPDEPCRPRPTSLNHFCANVQPRDVASSIDLVRSNDKSPLFWPFPFQGKPLLDNGELLEKSGFKIRLPESSVEISSKLDESLRFDVRALTR